ncbi:hypothetical protein GCM10027597_26920 [Saccharopolyspora tripterygii]
MGLPVPGRRSLGAVQAGGQPDGKNKIFDDMLASSPTHYIFSLLNVMGVTGTEGPRRRGRAVNVKPVRSTGLSPEARGCRVGAGNDAEEDRRTPERDYWSMVDRRS